jgi:hypothetical protein
MPDSSHGHEILGAHISTIATAITELAYMTWSESRPESEDTSRPVFDRVYVGHYATVEAYADVLIDEYGLDRRLDESISAPFRIHVDIDATSFVRALIQAGVLYTLRAEPVGVWVFNSRQLRTGGDWA